MQYRRILLGLLAIMIFCAWAMNPATAASKNLVQKMDTVELDALITAVDREYLIVVMAAWCGPCRDELPALNKLYEKYKKEGLNMIGISLDLEGPEAMQPIVDKFGVNFPIYWVGEKAMYQYDIFAIPMIFLVKEGKIAERITGRRSEEFLDQKIREFINKK